MFSVFVSVVSIVCNIVCSVAVCTLAVHIVTVVLRLVLCVQLVLLVIRGPQINPVRPFVKFSPIIPYFLCLFAIICV